ncbi:restriction endonuclease subunit S [Paracoccus sp. J39]|uniref:restriction endonuclease subunit S n=1 Tax=Paracoccus sp. J39 TaxID=935848 RepID=UPI0012EB8EBC|nr:restriction endonuclease subunit S [Paracoccus sp. J39]
MTMVRFKHFLKDRNQFSRHGDETLLSVSEYYGVKPRAEAFEGEEHESRAATLEGYRIVQRDDLVMNYMLAWKGAYGVSDHDGIVSPAYSVFVINKQLADPRFIHHRTRSADMRALFRSRSKGIIESRLRLYPDALLAMDISLPDLPTQKAIADFLDRETARIDLLIEKKQRLVARLAEREKALLHLMFSQIKAKRWRTRHLGNLRNGAGFPVELQGNPNEDIAFFKVKHLKTFGLDAAITATEDTVSAETARKLRATVFPVGTIVFAKIGAALLLGRFSMIGRPACLDNNMAAFVPNKRMIDADFCLLALSQIDMATMVQPGAVPSLSTEAFYSYELPLPSLEEQQELVSRFRSERATLSSIADATKTSIERLREFRAALITAAVTGQINPETWSRRGTTDRRLDQIEAEMGA